MKLQSRSRYFFVVLVYLGMLAPSLNAQYFGRNKVQYETFDYKILKTEHFDIYFYPEMQPAAEQAARMAERWYARLARMLNHELQGKQPLILYSSSPHFQQTTAIPGILGEGVGGVTEIFKRRIVLPLAASLAASDHVIGHELVHAFQFDLTSQGHSAYARQSSAVLRLPLWMIEGMAEYLSIGSVDPHTSMWMRDATRREDLPTIKKLIDPRFFPYRYGQSVWAYITGKWGDGAVARIIKSVGKTGSHEASIEKVLGISVKELSEEWHASLVKAYSPLYEKTNVKVPDSQPLIEATKENRVNVSPALSPDGKKIVMLSTKDLFSIDMFLADAETGKFEKKLISTAVDPHFESLQFIKSAGSWDKAGNRFVFSAISKGEPVLTIIEMERGHKEREIKFEGLGEILSPTWSPDGRHIAFSAQVGGVSDLYLYDLESENLQRLTDDPFGDLQPAWSPDGKYIAFVTERFSTDLSILSINELEIGLYRLEGGEVLRVPGFKRAKHINPQWAPDSKSLYFLSDQNGITNVYNIKLETENISQITNLYTGVSGITETSPALSVAQASGRVAFCYYEDSQFSIHTIEATKIQELDLSLSDFASSRPAVLPPRSEPSGELLGLLKNPLFGLPEEVEYEVEDYGPKLKLDYVSQPTLAIGRDRFGTYAGGGIVLNFSDMLGYRNLATLFQVNSRIQDSLFLVGYQNSRKRFNWGAVVQRIPYLTGGYSAGFSEAVGMPAYLEQEIIFRQINYQLSAYAAYPFSQVQRFELSGGYRFIDFDYEVRTRAFSAVDGTFLYNEVEKLPSPDGIHMGFASAAMVYDSSLFGATAPILGQSYVLQVSPNIGTLDYTSFLADYRRYLMPLKPFTLAFRLMHYGRYGGGAEDSRLYPLFLGYDWYVRGYNSSSFDYGEFVGGDFSAYDQLFGSKMMVANVELRFPLFQVLGIGSGYYGILPIDFLAFFDTGLAWFDEGDARAWFLGGERKPVSSVGVGLRMNLFGYLILGVSYVRPLDRPGRAPYFQFTFYPGF